MENAYRKKLGAFLAFIIFIALISGCMSIPQEAPDLSRELGKRITAVEKSHIALLHKLMNEKRRQVDEFITKTWVPTFAEEYFKQPHISNVWDLVVQSNDPNDRLELLRRVGPKLQERINEERLELIKPIDDLENDIENILREEYSQAKAINNSITNLLASAAKTEKKIGQLLEFVGIEDEKISNAINGADEAIGNLITKKDDITKRLESFKKTIETVRKALEKKNKT